MEELEQRLQNIENRNKKVEADKAWETSWTRRSLLTIFTYIVIGVYLQAINVPRPWLNALVPAIGFLLSTLVMTYFKKYWLERHKK